MHATKPLMSVTTNSLTGFSATPSLSLHLPHSLSGASWLVLQSILLAQSCQLSCHQTGQASMPFSATSGDISYYSWPKKKQKKQRMQFPLYSALLWQYLCTLYLPPACLLMDLHVAARSGRARPHAELPVRKCASQDIPFRGVCFSLGLCLCLGRGWARNRNWFSICVHEIVQFMWHSRERAGSTYYIGHKSRMREIW